MPQRSRGLMVVRVVAWVAAAGLVALTFAVGSDVVASARRDAELTTSGVRMRADVVDVSAAPGPRSTTTRYLVRYRAPGSTTDQQREVTASAWRAASSSRQIDVLVSSSDPDVSEPVGVIPPSRLTLMLSIPVSGGAVLLAVALSFRRRTPTSAAAASGGASLVVPGGDGDDEGAELLRRGPFYAGSRDGSRWIRVTGRATVTLHRPCGDVQFYADHFGEELLLSREYIVDAGSGEVLGERERHEALSEATAMLGAIGDRVEILEDQPRPVPGFPFDALGPQRPPSEAADLLAALLGQRVISLRRCVPQPSAPRPDAASSLEEAAGPALVAFDHGVVLGVGRGPDAGSVVVWVDSVPHGKPRPGAVGADSGVVTFDLADSAEHGIPIGWLDSAVREWRMYPSTHRGRRGDQVLVMGTDTDPLAFAVDLDGVGPGLRILTWERVRPLVVGATPTRIDQRRSR